MERRGIFGDRRVTDRRTAGTFRVSNPERRSGLDRRARERRTDVGDRRCRDPHYRARQHPAGTARAAARTSALPPVSRIIPAAVVVLISLVDLFVAQATSYSAWGFALVPIAILIAAFALRAPQRWHLAAVWFGVGVYVMAVGFHIAYLLAFS